MIHILKARLDTNSAKEHGQVSSVILRYMRSMAPSKRIKLLMYHI